MLVTMTRSQYSSLPAKDEIVGSPIPGQYYRDPLGGVSIANFRDAVDWNKFEWSNFNVRIIG